MAKTLNTWTLGGLIVGPVLGSGILLLPPLAYGRLGGQAFWAWLAVLGLGAGFAILFIRLALKTRTQSGIAELTAQAWGPVWGELAANYLTGAVLFGAVPVFLTAARLWPRGLIPGWTDEAVAGVFLAAAAALLWAGLKTVSRLSLVLSSAVAVLLTLGSVVSLAAGPAVHLPLPDPTVAGLGPTLLLLFWAVVGWEVIGNYTDQVDRPEVTIPRAGAVGLAAVSTVYLLTTLALQARAPGPGASTALVLEGLLGPLAPVVAGVVGGGLCLTSVLMFVGAVTRMTDHRARQGRLPRFLAQRDPARPPRRAIAVHALFSAGLLGLTVVGWAHLEDLVSVSNLFFLGNALLGLAAAWKLLPGIGSRLLTAVLALVLLLLLGQGQPAGWAAFALVTGATALQAFRSSPPA